ncbi:polyprenyl synthetase family protein [Jongsikchunia kroppenstedtii]|uniref:polyprenyl synthetase family protein n=1 Tax=Jongsikchunia kroppenstedtii TaxID=1121721 RepID=UPI0003642D99|nr:polyprenyl synthetase family protein [Jongsikchunia kroppenstedtii]
MPIIAPARLDDVPAAAEAVLVDFFADRAAATEAISPRFSVAVDAVARYVLRGGKRIRPTFCWAGWQCGSGRSAAGAGSGGSGDSESDIAALRVAASLELIQACALIHDDIIDRSDTRRGHPTLHREQESGHRRERWHGDAEHFGTSAAILLGDLALAWADDMVRDAGLTPATAARLSPTWSAMRTEVLGGQYLDIVNEMSADESAASADQVMRFKTAAYTIERPLQLGAEMAGVPEEVVESLRRFGTDLGIAFQLRDDLLGAFGDPDVTGKPSGDDLVAGKRTAILAAAFNRLDENRADQLRGYVGRPLDDAELRQTRSLIADSGAVTAIETRIDALLTSARDTLDATPIPAPAKAGLSALATKVTDRRS